MSGPRQNNLTQPQSFRLYEWLNKSRVWASTATAQKCAELAAQELKFGITKSNVLSAKHALGITKPAPVAPAACRCRELAAALVVLFRQAGSTPPPCVVEIAGGRKPVVHVPELPGVTVPVAPGVSLTMGGEGAAAGAGEAVAS